ncbi:Ulp1 protease family protein [Abeliophyllum distichum]|uniref:Ulp1 protease family protein n=1 Tax=Abeliophyllum distichum TaxID=126358 RepID=A0ABD1PP25_9LAMI
MQLLRQRTIKYPKSFGHPRVILDVNFYVNCMLAMLELDATHHPMNLPEGFNSYFQGEFPKHGQKWDGCTHLYFPVCSRSHWYAVEVDIAKSTMFIYDPDKSCSTDDQIRADLKPSDNDSSYASEENQHCYRCSSNRTDNDNLKTIQLVSFI